MYRRKAIVGILASMAMVLALVGLVGPVLANGTTRYVAKTGSDTGDCSVSPCLTIQYAIDQAVAGDTINVAAGTYTQDLVINKANLELKGAGTATIIQGVDKTVCTSWPLADANIDIQSSGVKAHDFTFKNPVWVDGYYSSGMIVGAQNVEIYNVTFQGATSDDLNDVSQCFQTWNTVDVSGLNVHHNTFTTSGTDDYGYEGVFINSGGTGLVNIHDNTFSGRVIRAITTQRQNTTISNNTIITSLDTAHALQGIWVDEANVTVTNNEVKGGSGFGKGIDIGHAALALYGITVKGNAVGPGNDIGIRVRGNLTGTGVKIYLNNIVGNTTYGVDASAVTGGSINAENNWWGANDGPSASPGSGDKISANVDAVPYLVLNISANPAAIAADGTSTSTITADMTKNSDSFDTSILGYIRDGTQINFTTDKGSIGSLTTTKTTTNGKAEATLTSSTTAETATVTASAPPHTAAATATTTVDFTAVPPGPPHTVTLTADPTSIVADGVSTSELTATVEDEDGNPVADGTEVHFSTDLGTLDGAASRDMVVKTTTGGVATATLTSTTTPGTATVEAMADSIKDSTTVEFTAPTPPTAPLPPRRIKPARRAVILLVDHRVPVRFAWRRRAGATQYHLRVWRRQGGSWKLVINEVLTRRRFRARLRDGVYRWKVRAGLGGGVWGRWNSRAWRFRIR